MDSKTFQSKIWDNSKQWHAYICSWGHFDSEVYIALEYSFLLRPLVLSISYSFLLLEHMQTITRTIAITTIAVAKIEPPTATPRTQICTYPLIVASGPAKRTFWKGGFLNRKVFHSSHSGLPFYMGLIAKVHTFLCKLVWTMQPISCTNMTNTLRRSTMYRCRVFRHIKVYTLTVLHHSSN